MPDEARFGALLATYQRRIRLTSIAWSAVAASAAVCLTAVALGLSGRSIDEIRAFSILAFVLASGGLGGFAWKRWTLARVAAAIEAHVQGLDNLLVTAEQISARNQRVHPIVRGHLFWDAAERLQRATNKTTFAAIGPAAALACAAIAAAGIFVNAAPRLPASNPRSLAVATIANLPLQPGDLRVIVSPPPYTARSASTVLNPTDVSAIEGSRVRLEAASADGPLQVIEPGRDPIAFTRGADRWTHEFTLGGGFDAPVGSASRVLLIQRRDVENRDTHRLVQFHVEVDRRPLVRILVPGKDLIFAEPKGEVRIEIDARDDLALSSLTLRYTRVVGSGETFTFEEGEVPVRVQAKAPGEWQGSGTLSLETLKLADGDTLVYRAVAADGKPGADPSASESFLIEIGRLAGVASTGFAVPEERDRQAISQQMLIIKTERLHASRAAPSTEAFADQARLLAIEQRMIKAEFIFMTGGEVADEVEEATHAPELVEGRFENTAQLELLNAIREMSRAEARLNAADTTQALVFERNALRALQRAFDRRRYLLRTLPERTRIDTSRRLTGERTSALPARRVAMTASVDPTVATARQLMHDLATAIEPRQGIDAAIAARVLSIDPASETLQRIVVSLTSARDRDARVVAAREAQHHLAEFVHKKLAAGGTGRVPGDPLPGLMADQVARGHR